MQANENNMASPGEQPSLVGAQEQMSQWVEQRPWLMLAGAAAIGFMLGSRERRRMNTLQPPTRLDTIVETVRGQPRPTSLRDFANRYQAS